MSSATDQPIDIASFVLFITCQIARPNDILPEARPGPDAMHWVYQTKVHAYCSRGPLMLEVHVGACSQTVQIVSIATLIRSPISSYRSIEFLALHRISRSSISLQLPHRHESYHTIVAKLSLLIGPLSWQVGRQATSLSRSSRNTQVSHSTSALAVRSSSYGLAVMQLTIIPRSTAFELVRPGHLQQIQ